MKKLQIGLVGIAAVVMSSGIAFAQTPSAKFAATWSNAPLMVETSATTCNPDLNGFETKTDTGTLLATMKMPSQKEILAGISAESSIILNTTVSGKNGGSGTATGIGTVDVHIKAVNVDTGAIYLPAPSDAITLNARTQTLSATLGGVISSCTDSNGDGTIDVATECTVTPEQIGLITKNTSANHFNVLFPNLPAGVYQIRALFTVTSTSDTTVAGVVGDACAYAGSTVVLGNRIVTMEDVRAVKGETAVVEVP